MQNNYNENTGTAFPVFSILNFNKEKGTFLVHTSKGRCQNPRDRIFPLTGKIGSSHALLKKCVLKCVLEKEKCRRFLRTYGIF